MSNNPETQHNKKSRLHRLRVKQKLSKAGAVLGSTIALGGTIAQPAGAEAPPGKGGGADIVRVRHVDPQELPGLKIHLSKERLDQIKNSTLEIVFRTSPNFGGSPTDTWSPSCTAVKVSIPGEKGSYIMSAAHCFSALTGVTSGAFTDYRAPNENAENFIKASPYEYAIVDPNANHKNQFAQPIAMINGISIDTNNQDVALLRPVALPKLSTAPITSRGFNDIPAIPLKVAETAPIQGTPVALYGEPQAGNFEPISGTGVYLGRVSYNEAVPVDSVPDRKAAYRQLDLVGINPATPQADNCNFGTSGSMALLPDGRLLGNLSLRAGEGYYAPNANQQPQDSLDFYNFWKAVWEDQLGVDLTDFDVICGYTVMNANTPYDLVHGLKVPVILYAGK